MEVIEKNYPLLILSKGEKLLEFFEEVVRRGLTEYIEILFQVGVEIDPETLTEGVIRMARMHPEYEANLERALAKLFAFSPESVRRMSPFREFLEEQEQLFEKEKRALEEEKRNASRKAMIQAKREALSLLLESKFGQPSEAVVSKLEALREVEQLDGLYRLALRAQTLEEIGL